MLFQKKKLDSAHSQFIEDLESVFSYGKNMMMLARQKDGDTMIKINEEGSSDLIDGVASIFDTQALNSKQEIIEEKLSEDQWRYEINKFFLSINMKIMLSFILAARKKIDVIESQLEQAIKALEEKNDGKLKAVSEELKKYREESRTQSEQDKMILDGLNQIKKEKEAKYLGYTQYQ